MPFGVEEVTRRIEIQAKQIDLLQEQINILKVMINETASSLSVRSAKLENQIEVALRAATIPPDNTSRKAVALSQDGGVDKSYVLETIKPPEPIASEE